MSRPSHSQVQMADPTARKKAFIWVTLALLFGLVFVMLFERYQDDLQQWLQHGPATARNRLLLASAVLTVMLLPLFLLSRYLWRLGDRTLRDKRFPPKGVTVVVDTPILSDEAAVFRGHLLRFFALCISTFAGAAIFSLWWLANKIAGV